jgi:phosphate transport system substrate-binding protein
MRLLGDAYTTLHPETTITVLKSIGSSGAFKAVPKGAIEIGLSSRPATDEESQRNLRTVEYGRSPTVFTVRMENPVRSITMGQIADIYSGKMQTWPDGEQIRPVMRQPGDDNSRQVSGLSPEIGQAILEAINRNGLPFAVTDQEAANKAETIPGSFGVSALALILSEKRNLRALSIDGIAPTPENLSSGRYPLRKTFYFVLPIDPAPAAKDFINFVVSPAGREVLRQTGHSVH